MTTQGTALEADTQLVTHVPYVFPFLPVAAGLLSRWGVGTAFHPHLAEREGVEVAKSIWSQTLLCKAAWGQLCVWSTSIIALVVPDLLLFI